MVQKCEILYDIHLYSKTFCKYYLKVYDRDFALSFPQLLQLRSKLYQLTLPLNLTELINNENFVLIFIADKQHLLFLEIHQLLQLKEEMSRFFNEYYFK